MYVCMCVCMYRCIAHVCVCVQDRPPNLFVQCKGLVCMRVCIERKRRESVCLVKTRGGMHGKAARICNVGRERERERERKNRTDERSIPTNQHIFLQVHSTHTNVHMHEYANCRMHTEHTRARAHTHTTHTITPHLNPHTYTHTCAFFRHFSAKSKALHFVAYLATV